MTISKRIAAALLAATLSVGLTACGSSASSESVASSLQYQVPDGCTLSNEDMEKAIENYTAYVSQAIADDGYTISFEVNDAGKCRFTGTYVASHGSSSSSDSDSANSSSVAAGTDEKVPSLMIFNSIPECFGYLYQAGQLDINGTVVAGMASADTEQADSETASVTTKEAAMSAASQADSAASTASSSSATIG